MPLKDTSIMIRTIYLQILSGHFCIYTKNESSYPCKNKRILFWQQYFNGMGTNIYQELEGKIDGHYIDDYSSASTLFKDIFSSRLLTVYEKIHNQLDSEDKLFLRPNINGDNPDLVLFKPHVGIVLFDVNDNLFSGYKGWKGGGHTKQKKNCIIQLKLMQAD